MVKKYSDLDFTDSFISLSYRHCQLEGGHDTSEETILHVAKCTGGDASREDKAAQMFFSKKLNSKRG